MRFRIAQVVIAACIIVEAIPLRLHQSHCRGALDRSYTSYTPRRSPQQPNNCTRKSPLLPGLLSPVLTATIVGDLLVIAWSISQESVEFRIISTPLTPS